MSEIKIGSWERFQKYYADFPALGLSIDLSRMHVDDAFFTTMEPRMQKAFADMDALEKGAIANPDENRMVGHYWLRTPALAPTPEIRKEIEETVNKIKGFAAEIHSGKIKGAKGPFKNYLLIGIGGSALGPQFVAHALGDPRKDKLKPHFFDNTDPNGIDRVLATIGDGLGQTLCIVISKSGGTKETRNGMLLAKAAYEAAGLDFGQHTVAITTAGSDLDKLAVANKWCERFPMWDWVGGRTSELSAVGLLPAALQGFDISKMLQGASECDKATRNANVKSNPSALLSLAFYASGNGKGTKNMVTLPYFDRLELFSKYLQQLFMESLGKEKDLNNQIVNQGLTVLGNKGATDQHSYIQQLREGLNDFFVAFIEVLQDGGTNFFVEPDTTSGDFLHGFYLGTRQALTEKDRESLTITINEVSEFTVGLLIALFERAVGFYASLISINAYHQPGVEAGKKAAGKVIDVQRAILKLLTASSGKQFTVAEIAREIQEQDHLLRTMFSTPGTQTASQAQDETVFKICEHLAANPARKIVKSPGPTPFEAKYSSK